MTVTRLFTFRRTVLLLALLACAGLSACSGQRTPELQSPVLVVSGLFVSQEEVGPLGRLTLNLLRREDTFTIYDATLSGEEGGELGEDDGVGTLGNSHLILNFDRGTTDDYYFQGQVSMDGDLPDTLVGTFVFPDQTEQLSVTFDYTGPAIPEPEE
ncbi:hypothetical protein IT575_03835 [bacterium]|nr:hypothetical protein [bacterium]